MELMKVVLILSYGGVLLYTAASKSQLDKSDACARASMCSLNRADLIFITTNKTTHRQYVSLRKNAIDLIKKDKSKKKEVIAACEHELGECEAIFKAQAHYAGYPRYLVEPCYTRSIPYTMFLCRTIPTWPKEVTSVAPEWFTKCDDYCPTIPEFNKLHILRGKSVYDFPSSWQRRVDNQMKSNSVQQEMDAEFKPDPGPEQRARSDWLPEEVFTMYVFDRHRDIGTERNEPNLCPEGTYVGTITVHNLHGLQGNCTRLGKSGKVQRVIGSPFSPKIKPPFSTNTVQCVSSSFVIGMKFATREIENLDKPGTTTVISNAHILCSGSDWLPEVEHPDDDEFGQEHDCPPLTALCMIEGFRLEIDDQPYLVNLKLGCCAMDIKNWYSSIPQEKFLTYKNPEGKHGQEETEKLVFGSLTQSEWSDIVFCPPGSFVNRFVWSSNIPGIRTGTGLFSDKLFLMNRQIFLCNDYGLTHGQFGVPIGIEAYPKDYLQIHENTHVIPVANVVCEGGFFTGGHFSAIDVPSNADDIFISYTMKCGDEWLGKTVSTNEWNLYANGKDSIFVNFEAIGVGNFTCRAGYAICGLRYRKGLTLHGPYFEFVCCPVPRFWPPFDCRSTDGKIIYDLQIPETDCQFQFGIAETCFVTEGRTYETTNITGSIQPKPRRKRRQTDKFIDKYGFTLSDKLTAMVKHPRRVIGPFMTDIMDVVPDARIVTGVRRRKRQTPQSVIASAIIAGIAGMFSAGVNKIPGPPVPGGAAGAGGAGGLVGPTISFESSIKQIRRDITKTHKTVDETQSAFFYDIVLKCGFHRLYSDQKLRFVTPSKKGCVVEDRYEFIQKYTENKAGPGQPSSKHEFTTIEGKNFGVGLFISSDPRGPLERAIKWDKLTLHVKLAFAGRWNYTKLNEGLINPDDWNEYNPYDKINMTLTVPRGETYCIYRFMANCAPYEVYTRAVTFYPIKNASDPCPYDADGLFVHLFHAPKLMALP